MSKHYSKKRRLKYVFLAVACTASFSFTGLAAACSNTPDTDDDTTNTAREDTQLLKNGNFEFFDVPEKEKDGNEPVYLINTPNNWTHGGTSSYTMTGIIGTSATAWDKIADEELKDKLDYNNGLDTSASNYKSEYVDYNGMKSSDILYRDTWAALNESSIEDWADYFGIVKDNGRYYYGETEVYAKVGDEDDDEKVTFYFDTDYTKPVSREVIANPGTHYDVKEDSNGLYYMDGSERVTVYEDDKGDYYLSYDEDKDEYSEPISHVLMLHNYATTHNGIAQTYSSVSIDLPANTAAEVSLWVKTSDLLFDQGKDVKQERGANISVTHTIGSTTLDDFSITCINTEKLISEGADNTNGWLQYTVYVNSCDFASSTITLKLGLGDTNLVEGYAFFDDVTVTKYTELDSAECSYSQYKQTIKNDDAQWTLSRDVSEKVFVADTYVRNAGIAGQEVVKENYSKSFRYLLDLASENEYSPVKFGTDSALNLKAGLTVDEDKYISSMVTSGITYLGFNGVDGIGKDVKLPDELKNLKIGDQSGVGIDTKDDLLAYVKAGENALSAISGYKYYDRLNEAIVSAADLPKTENFGNDGGNVLVMLSAKGAAYTSSFELTVAGGDYQIISFWVKTSDMNGNSAATVKLTDKDNEDNTVNVALDSTGVVTDIDDEHEDIYNGWVQCFFFVHNEDEDNAKTLEVEFCFGNTTLNGTTVTSYKPGWVALANMQTLVIDEDTFGYTTNDTYSATLTLSEQDTPKTNVFDEVLGNQTHDIEYGIVDPSNYTGVNGGSTWVKYNENYDEYNPYSGAGLINKEYSENYKDTDWYKTLLSSFGVNTLDVNYSDVDALTYWTEVFGTKSIQPLIIINSDLRDSYVQVKKATEETYTNYFIKNDDGEFVRVQSTDEFDETEIYYDFKEVLNYGFIGSENTISANSYQTVSVRVKVSAGAVAYVYLVDTSADKQVLSFTAPSYSFWYDEDGNVLKAEPDPDAKLSEQRANVLYTLRDDGLYEDKEGNLYANLYNYTKVYTDEQGSYYDAEGNHVSFDDLVKGETYWVSAEAAAAEDMTKVANHYLTSSDGVKLYEFVDGDYYYIVDSVTQKDKILPFDTAYARYDFSDVAEDYVFVLDARYDANGKFMTESGAGELGYDKDGNKVADEWFTVNFVIHTGSESKAYRLELWSGERGEETTSGGLLTAKAGSSVIFDYSYTSVSDDTLKDAYENEIIKAYQSLLTSKGYTIASSTENISYYEKLVAECDDITESDIAKYEILGNYRSRYYTFSLYDSANFQPFNKETADENTTGYDYSTSDYEETLAYLEIKDDNVYTVFADYSTIDNSISLGTDTDNGDDDTTTDSDDDESSFWLLLSSILLVVALLFTMLSILVKDAVKKARRNRAISKNNYNHNKANRYIRKLGIKKEEFEEVDASADESAEYTDGQPAEDGQEELSSDGQNEPDDSQE